MKEMQDHSTAKLTDYSKLELTELFVKNKTVNDFLTSKENDGNLGYGELILNQLLPPLLNEIKSNDKYNNDLLKDIITHLHIFSSKVDSAYFSKLVEEEFLSGNITDYDKGEQYLAPYRKYKLPANFIIFLFSVFCHPDEMVLEIPEHEIEQYKSLINDAFLTKGWEFIDLTGKSSFLIIDGDIDDGEMSVARLHAFKNDKGEVFLIKVVGEYSSWYDRVINWWRVEPFLYKRYEVLTIAEVGDYSPDTTMVNDDYLYLLKEVQ